MEAIMDNVLAIIAMGLVVVIGVVIKYWNKSYKGISPADVINEDAVVDFLVTMAKKQNLNIEQKEDIDFLIEFGRLKLGDFGINVDKAMLEKVVAKVKEELKK